VKIAAVETRPLRLAVARPYTISTPSGSRTIDAIDGALVILRDDAGRVGLGTATPEVHVTGETAQRCQEALAGGALDFLVGVDLETLPALLARLGSQLGGTPAARAAVDMALHDLFARGLGVSLGALLGRCSSGMLTSITIGIKPLAETLAEADEYVGRGFRVLKVKIGRSLDEDLERLARLGERVGRKVVLRADANQGYTLEETRRFFASTAGGRGRDLEKRLRADDNGGDTLAERPDRAPAATIDVELLEQPIPAASFDELRALPGWMKTCIAADESLLTPADALRLATPDAPAGIFNIKLMKCGGLAPARAIAAIAEAAGIRLMWGCMDESCIGIAAALHVALASPNTHYLDLDGSFDLARDIARGGFVVEDGCLRPSGGPGLGVELLPDEQ
jgi:L-alanine-DL-glutamate epimerase-like enolase superfamily enzyme